MRSTGPIITALTLGALILAGCGTRPAPAYAPEADEPALSAPAPARAVQPVAEPAPEGQSVAEIVARLGQPPAIADEGQLARSLTVTPEEIGAGYRVARAMPLFEWEPLTVSAWLSSFAHPSDPALTVLTFVDRDLAVGTALVDAYDARFQVAGRYNGAISASAYPLAERIGEDSRAFRLWKGGAQDGWALIARDRASVVVMSADTAFGIERLAALAAAQLARMPKND